MEKNFCFNFPVTPSDYFFAYNIWGAPVISVYWHTTGACPGGAQGASPPPLEIEKAKKKWSSEQILSYFAYILLLF